MNPTLAAEAPPNRDVRAEAADLLARLCVGVLFVFLTIGVWNEFARTGHLTGLLLVASESLVVVLMIIRRRTHIVDRSAAASILTIVSVVGPPLVRPGTAMPLVPDQLTAMVSGFGLVVVIAGKVMLGRSFGLVPANRGVVTQGPYALVRHPIYSGYFLTHVAFVAAHPTMTNIALLGVADAATIGRALLEERVLAVDRAYQAYCARVAWHFLPGVF